MVQVIWLQTKSFEQGLQNQLSQNSLPSENEVLFLHWYFLEFKINLTLLSIMQYCCSHPLKGPPASKHLQLPLVPCAPQPWVPEKSLQYQNQDKNHNQAWSRWWKSLHLCQSDHLHTHCNFRTQAATWYLRNVTKACLEIALHLHKYWITK